MDNKKICLVAIKKVINPYAKVKIITNNADDSSDNNYKCNKIDLQNVPFVINPLDEIAIEAAVQLKTQGKIDHIIAVSIGSDCKDILTQALARGADRAILIQTAEFISPLNIAKILKYLIMANNVNLAILGKQAVDYDFNQTGQMLAGLLNWPQACFASKISFNHNECNNNLNNFDLSIDREIDTGLETLQLKLPAIITVDLLLNEPQRLNLNQLLQAKKKSIDIIDLQDLINKQLISLDFNQLKILTNNYPTVSVKNCIKINNPLDLIQKLITEDKVLIRY